MRTTVARLALVGGLATAAVTGCSGDEPAARGPAPLLHLDPLTGTSTSLTLGRPFAEGLRALGIAVAPLGGAALSPEGVATFPVTGGELTCRAPGTADPWVTGAVHHDGSGLSLSKGGTTVALTDLDLDPGASLVTGDVAAGGSTVAEDAPLFLLDGRTLQPLRREGDQAVLDGARVLLTRTSADLLDAAFRTTAAREGALVGVARVSLTVPA